MGEPLGHPAPHLGQARMNPQLSQKYMSGVIGVPHWGHWPISGGLAGSPSR